MLLTALALRSTRAIPVAALLLLPLANGSITTGLSRARDLTPALQKWLDEMRRYGDGLEAAQRGFRGFALVPLVAIPVFTSIRSGAGFAADKLPVGHPESLLPSLRAREFWRRIFLAATSSFVSKVNERYSSTAAATSTEMNL